MAQPKTIRDLREHKNLSQDKVAAACGLTYSQFVRIEEGSGKTTAEEVKAVMAVLKEMEPGTRKLAGRPFKDPEKQAAVTAAREAGLSVAEVLGVVVPAKAPRAARAPKKADDAPAKASKGNVAAALAKKASPRSRSRAKGTSSLSSLLP